MSNPVSDSQFLDEHAPLVYNLALRLTGNASDAEDLAQDALIRALKALPQFRGESSMATWVYRITVNTWKNRVRSEKRRGLWKMISMNLFTGEERDEEPAFKANDAPLDYALETSERGALVQSALLGLDEDSRAVLVLRELQGQSYQQISQALEIPEGTVKSRLSRAREALKERLQKVA